MLSVRVHVGVLRCDTVAGGQAIRGSLARQIVFASDRQRRYNSSRGGGAGAAVTRNMQAGCSLRRVATAAEAGLRGGSLSAREA